MHVNTEHLDFLSPEGEEGHYLDSGGSEFGSLWELDKCAGRGLTEGILYYVHILIFIFFI